MKLKRLNLLLLIWLSITGVLYGGNYKLENGIVTDEMRTMLQNKLLNTRLGNEYMVVVTPNDKKAGGYAAEIYIGAKEPCTVYIEQPAGRGLIAKYNIIRPYDIVKKKFKGDGEQKAFEVRGKDEEPEDLPLRVYSDKEIMVYFGTHAGATAEGYMALPVNVLGKHYVHCSSKNNNESTDEFHTGFIIGAVSDNTKVKVKLRGKNLGASSGCVTDGGHYKIGDNFELRLDEWQAINVWDEIEDKEANHNIPQGLCDFTGTTITSNKPIAIYSYVERTGLPAGGGSRDHLVEQLLPVNLWGKKFLSVQLKSKSLSASASDVQPPLFVGDYFRVVASEPETNLNVTWWDPRTGDEIKSLKNQMINTDGEWWEYNPNSTPQRPLGVFGIQGVALFEANKPIQVMQYCYSSGWGVGGDFDPFMVLVPPTEQYGYETIFQTSSYSSMKEHLFTLLAQGDPNDLLHNEELLSTVSISMKGSGFQPIKDKDEKFLTNNIPTTDYYFATLPCNSGSSYSVRARTKVAGYIYGFGGVISYAWPASMALVETSAKDTLKPEVYHVFGCAQDPEHYLMAKPDRIGQKGVYKFVAFYADSTDLPAPNEFEDPQEDLGLSFGPVLIQPNDEDKEITEEEQAKLDNIEITRYVYIKPKQAPTNDWNNREPIHQGAIEFTIKDMYADALGFASYRDRAGNTTVDTMIYIADKLEWYAADNNELQIEDLDFGSKTIGGTYTLIAKLKNASTKEVTINEMFLAGNNSEYSITKGNTSLPLNIGPGQEEEIEVTYIPTSGGTCTDSIVVYTECLKFILPVYGISGIAKIEVTDIDFGQVLVGTKSYKNINGKTAYLQITNKGSEDLVITGYSWEVAQDPTNGPFLYEPYPANSDPTAANPKTVKPGQMLKSVKKFAFMPDKVGPFEVKLYFESNAADSNLDPHRKEYAILRGYGIQPGPKITSYDWGERRVKTINDFEIELRNTGNTKLVIKNIDNSLDNWQTDANGDLVSPDGSYRVFKVAQYEGMEVHPESGTEEPKLIKIKVRFEPQSEYDPIGTCPTNVKFYVNFEKEAGIADNTIYSSLSGKGILPKISVTGYKFPNTKEETECAEIGSLVIRNTSESAKLHIKSIKFKGGQQEGDFTLEPALNAYDGTDIPINDSVVYSVKFKPENTTPPQRLAEVLIENDAKEGPEVNPIIVTDTLLEGTTFDLGSNCNNIDFGTVTRCAEEVSNIIIHNESTTNELTVSNIIIDDEYKDILIVDPADYQDKKIGAGNTLNVPVRLIASAYQDEGDIVTTYTVETDVVPLTGEIKARILVLPVELSLDRHENQTPGRTIDFPVHIKMSDKDSFFTYENAKLTSFKIVLKLDLNAARIVGAEGPWTYNVSSDFEAGTVTITGKGSALKQDGILCNLKLQILASDNNDFAVSFESISFDERDVCISTTNVAGSVQYTICAEDLRGMRVTANKFYIDPVTPNPYTDDNLRINYSVGFDVDVTLSIYDASGRLVKSVVNGAVKGGKHNADVNVHDLGSGVYTIIMKSGPYKSTQQLNIVK